MNTHFARDDRILLGTRLLALFVSPFLLAASVILLILPTQTGALFAWPIQPPMTAMMLGSAYLAGLYFFIRAAFARQWHTVQAGFLPVAAFAALLGIATLLHWDRFTPGHISFITWAAIYFVAPFLVLGAWIANRRTDPTLPAPGERLLPAWTQWLLRLGGVAGIAFGVWMFLLPGPAAAIWPWKLSPLTARVVAAMILLAGFTDLRAGLDRRWSAAPIGLQTQTFSLFLILTSTLRDWASFNPAQPGAWIWLVGISLLLIALIALQVWMPTRRPMPQ